MVIKFWWNVIGKNHFDIDFKLFREFWQKFHFNEANKSVLIRRSLIKSSFNNVSVN